MRLFVAVWLPAPVLDALARLDRPENPAWRWTTEDQWHVTLAFLGELDPSSLPAVEASLAAALTEVDAPVRAEVSGPSAVLFPGILAFPVAGLDELAAVVRRAVDEPSVTAGRPFTGHLTLARARRNQHIPPQLAGAEITARWPVDQVTLVASTLDPDGARYAPVASFPVALERPPHEQVFDLQ